MTDGDARAGEERRRMAAVNRYQILDSPNDGAFDRVTAIAARAFAVPIAIISIVDHDRIWFKSHHGLDIDAIDRAPGLCASAVLQHDPWIVTSALDDPRTLANPLVAGDFGLQFYAGIPLETSDGYNLGTLCVIDHEPREVTGDEIALLEDLAAIVMDELELRLAARHAISKERELREQSQEISQTLQRIALPSTLPVVPGLEIGATYLPATTAHVGGDWYDAFALDNGRVAVTIGDVSGHGMAAAAVMGQLRNAIRAYAYHGFDAGATLQELDSLLQHVAPGQFATVAHFVIETGSGDYEAACAAHLPPMHIARGRCALLDWRPSAPVGTGFASAYETITGTLPAGECLLLYTDGLVERRGETIDAGIERLRATIEAALALDAGADAFDVAMSLTVDRELDDDVAAIIISRAP